MKNNTIYLIGVICLLTSCLGRIDTPNPLQGTEVSFSATLNGIETRTLYGEEVHGDGKDFPATAIKVNWVHNDLITIYGSECTAVPQAEDRGATVSVNDGKETPISGQNYAS